MYTASIKTKDEIGTGVRVTVAFTNGTDTFDEVIEPQTKSQFWSWVEGRLFTLNEQEEMKVELPNERPVVEPTQVELDKMAWFKMYNTLEQLEKLETKGFLTGARLTALTNKLTQARTFLDTNTRVEYLDEL